MPRRGAAARTALRKGARQLYKTEKKMKKGKRSEAGLVAVLQGLACDRVLSRDEYPMTFTCKRLLGKDKFDDTIYPYKVRSQYNPVTRANLSKDDARTIIDKAKATYKRKRKREKAAKKAKK